MFLIKLLISTALLSLLLSGCWGWGHGKHGHHKHVKIKRVK